jgi:protein TonB
VRQRRSNVGTTLGALGVSLLVHLVVILLLLPFLWKYWNRIEGATLTPVAAAAVQSQPPLQFEFVDLANDREEKPNRPDPAMSDLDRRAHGGEGEAADRAASTGNTPEKIQAVGADFLGSMAPPQAPAPQQAPNPQPQQPRPRQPQTDPDRQPVPDRSEGAGAPETQPQTQSEAPAIRLPQAGSWALPPNLGGLPQNPDAPGGEVDEGGISFDTQWYDWGPYAAKMLAKIRRNWRIPEIARLGVSGVVKVRFFIERDGTVTGVQILDESGRPPMDFAARDAITRSHPFDPLPSDLTGVDREGITITFYYNMRPEDRGR